MKAQRTIEGNIFSPIVVTQELIEYIRYEYTNNKRSVQSLAKELCCSDSSISRLMAKYNISARTDREQALKYTVNDDYFKKIDTEHKAYWLGFFYADGFIQNKRKHSNYKIGVTLTSIDRPHLEKLKSDLEYTGEVKDYKVTSGFKTDTACSRLLITSPKLATDLISHGCGTNKTFLVEFPTSDIVPEHLMRHFVRGLIDGDGCISYHKSNNKINYTIQLTDTESIVRGVLKFFGKENLKLSQRFKERNTNNYSITIGGMHQVYRILMQLYGDATIYLDRKYERFLHIKNEYEEKYLSQSS